MIRHATPGDALACGDILSAFIDDTPWMPRLHSRAEDIAFCAAMIDRGWVTVFGDRALGFMAQDGAEINALYVAAAAQRHGIGRALLHAAKAASGQLALWTFQANADARAFYTAEGFVEAELTDGIRNDERLPDVRLTWQRSA
ncbi:MAG: GNAT family N-acetyltransferase [Pseudomonadota bacterium]